MKRRPFGIDAIRRAQTLVSKQPKARLTALGFACVLLIGVADYLTGAEVSFSIFYLLPISAITWFAGGGVGALIAVASAVAWLVADLLWAAPYSAPVIPYWNATVRLGLFLIVVFLIWKFKSLNEHLEEEVEERTAALAQEIAERRRAEEALRQSEAYFRALIENALDVITILDAEGVIRYQSPSVERVLGYQPAELIGRNIVELLHPDDVPKVNVALEVVVSPNGTPGIAQVVEARLRHKDGSWRLLEAIGKALPSGLPVTGIVVNSRDITERMRAEEEAQRRLEQLEALREIDRAISASLELKDRLDVLLDQVMGLPHIDGASVMVLKPGTTELETLAVRGLSEEFAAMAEARLKDGLPRLVAKQKEAVAVDDLMEDERVVYRELFEGEGLASFVEFPLLAKGEPLGVLGIYSRERHLWSQEQTEFLHTLAGQAAIALENGRLYDVVRQELADRKRAEEELRESEERFALAVRGSDAGVWDWDIRNHTLYWSPRLKELLGYADDELDVDFDTFESHLHPDDREHTAAAIETHLKDRALYHVEQRLRTRSGEYRWFLARGQALWDEAGNPVRMVGSTTDITERKRLEDQLVQAQKMEAVGRLAGGVAHDFNNLLTVIHLSTRLLERKLHAEDPLWPHVQRIQDAGRRAANLTKQLLAFSRREIIEPKVLNLNDLLSELSRMLVRLIGEDIELVTALAKDLWPVYTDPTQMEQVIMNLAVNARDAMPTGGKLTLETANVVLDAAYAATHLEVEPGEHVMFAVSDTGTGMGDEVKAHLFEPFFTTKERGRGTGLGLATVFGIVKQNRGHIWVYSELGQGTAFKIYLPKAGMPKAGMPGASEGARAPSALPAADAAPSVRGSETLLLVEDEAEVRELVQNILLAQGYRVLVAQDGVEALQVARAHEGPIHLLVTDVVMPRMSGKALADQLRSSHPEMQVLYTSGYTDNAIVHYGVLAAGVHFLSKPFDLETLARKVRNLLDGSM
jgi:PAS domain S-box-containing protein